MVRILETKRIGHLRDTHAAKHQTFGTHDDETSDVVFRTLSQSTTHDVAEIAMLQTQHAGTVFHAGEPPGALKAFVVVVDKHLLESG